MVDSHLERIKCFVEQEQFIQEYKHKLHLFVPYDTFFVVLFKKTTHPNELLALRLPYLSTCQQMKLLYYDLIEPSAHETTRDGKIFWAGTREDDIPLWSEETQQRVEKILEETQRAWTPGPIANWEELVSHPDTS